MCRDLGILYKELEKSPLFQLSLASKELFHTNFLYWLANTDETRELFLELLGENIVRNLPAQWEARREYLHLDFCLTEVSKEDKGKKPAILLVIENKVKSIPSSSQLNEYRSKVIAHNSTVKGENKNYPCQFVLLTLAESNFPKVDEKVCDVWTEYRYSVLAERLEKIDREGLSAYQKQIINDYVSFVRNLHEVSSQWAKIFECFPMEFRAEINRLRLNDLFEKQHFSRMAEALVQRLKPICDCKKGGDIPRERGKSLSQIFMNDYKNLVYVHSDYSHGWGLLDIKIAAPGGKYILGIQLQEKQYRHYVEYPDSKKKMGFNKLKKTELIRRMDYFGNVAKDVKASVSKVSQDNFFHVKNDNPNAFCSFGNTFYYQYLIIEDGATINDILDLICHDIQWLLSQKNLIKA